jgi:AraC-like DNA-binding protein
MPTVDKQVKLRYNISKRLGDEMEYQNENFYGEYDFRSRFHKGWHMQPNLHEYSELIYCQKGSGLVIVNGKTIPLKEQEIVWIPPNYIHQYDFDDSAEVICAVFSNDFIPLFFKKINKRYFCPSAIHISEMSDVLKSFPEIKKEDLLRISGYLNLIGAIVIEQSSFENTGHTDGILCQKVFSYLAENFTESISLSQLAREFGYNEKYLSHTLHTLTGIHFRQLLNFYRINQAKEFLTNEREMNISEIATTCGFNSLNTFNREFKRIVGVTPSEYRRR